MDNFVGIEMGDNTSSYGFHTRLMSFTVAIPLEINEGFNKSKVNSLNWKKLR
jgi:hypothetical protein